MCTMCVQCLRRPEEGAGSSGSGVTAVMAAGVGAGDQPWFSTSCQCSKQLSHLSALTPSYSHCFETKTQGAQDDLELSIAEDDPEP